MRLYTVKELRNIYFKLISLGIQEEQAKQLLVSGYPEASKHIKEIINGK